MKTLKSVALALGGAFLAGTCGADVLTLSESTTWTDLSALEGYDGVEIAASKTLTLNPASGVTLDLTKPISGAGGVLKDGAGRLNLKADNTFTGAFVIGGTGSVYAYADGAFGSTAGRTTLYEYLYTGGTKTTDSAGASLYLCGIMTDEGFDIINNDKGGTFAAAQGTANVVNGSVTLTGSQCDFWVSQNATLRFRGGVSGGGQIRPNTEAGGLLAIEEKPLTSGMWNARTAAGTFLLAAPGNSCSYTWHPITLGCDWAFNGASPSWGTGGTHMKIDLNGYANRVKSISVANAAMNGYVTSARGKAFLHCNSASDVTTYLPFRGRAGYFQEGSGTTTFARTSLASNASDTKGALCVTNGTVAFSSGAAWPNVTEVTVTGRGAVTVCEAGQIGSTAVLTLADDGLLTLPADTALTVRALCLDGVGQKSGTYSAAQLNGHLAGDGATIVVTDTWLPNYAHVIDDETWGDAQLASLASLDGIQLFAGATLTLSNSVAYALKKPVAGAGTLVLDGSAQFDLDAANPAFDGAIEVRGFGKRVVRVNAADALGTTAGATTVYLSKDGTSNSDGTSIRFGGITTDENFTFKCNDVLRYVYATASTVNTFNGNIVSTGSQIPFMPEANASFVFNGSFSGGTVALSPCAGAEIVFNCPCTASFFNSHVQNGTVVFNTTGNTPLGYFGCYATFNVDYAWDNVDVSLGMQYNANAKIDLNGHDQRVKAISAYRDIRSTNACSYATDTTGTKSFLHVNTTATADSRVYFKGTAGLWWENTGTVTFKETTSTSRGDLMVAAGKVVFDTATWRGGDVATVKSGATLEIKDATKFAFHHLVVEEGGKVVMASGALQACDVTLGATTYPAGSTVDFADHAEFLEGAGAILCSGDYVIDVPAANADTVVTNEVAIPASAMRIVKRGAGTAYAKLGSNATTCSEIIVEEGVLGVACAADVGALLNTGVRVIRVKEGATFDLGGMNDGNAGALLRNTSVEIAGAGATRADGTRLGALRRWKRTGEEVSSNAHRMFASLALTADATVATVGMDCGCATDARKALNGHTLTKNGGNQWYMGGEVTPGNYVVNGGTLIFFGNPKIEGGATNFVRLAGGNLTFNNCTDGMKPVPHTLELESADSNLNVYNQSGRWAGPWKLGKTLTVSTSTESPANGVLTMTGPVTSTNALLTVGNAHPTLRLASTNRHDVGSIQVMGTLELRDGGHAELHPPSSGEKGEITLAQSTSEKIRAWGYPARMVISNATFTSAQATTAAKNVYGNFVLAWSANNGAELEIQPGAVVTGALMCAQGGLGAVRQTGGTFVARDVSGKKSGTILGGGTSTSYASYTLDAGTFVAPHALSAASAAGSTSILRQRGGTFVSGIEGSESFDARAGYLSLLQTGGTFTNASAISFGTYTATGGKANGGRFEIGLSGAETRQYHYWDIRVGGNHTYVDSTVFHVADGATLDLRCFNYVRPTGAEGRRFHFGADGGILQPHVASEIFNGEPPDTATVYAGGLVVDTSRAGGSASIKAALKKPTGKVVTGVTLLTDAAFAAEKSYLGPARVVISGGSGAGATAVTEFDPATHTLTGARVVSPGTGYAAGDAVTATLEGQFKTTSYACAVTLGDPDTTGGLTKRGANTLVMTGANDYAGVTRIEGGTLDFRAGAYPSESDVVITVEAANEARESGVPALIVNGFPAGRTVTVLGAEKIALDGLSRPIRLVRFDGVAPASVTCRALNSDGSEHVFADGNGLYYANGKISLGKPSGFMMIVR